MSTIAGTLWPTTYVPRRAVVDTAGEPIFLPGIPPRRAHRRGVPTAIRHLADTYRAVTA